ncbi:hypothetical protein DFJ73DRAFT_793092 [Zopfochytrium polystomum]|nr:hypothetical protein DFJ73DRAFT_793092 [Zopfochytrium polystomum]
MDAFGGGGGGGVRPNISAAAARLPRTKAADGPPPFGFGGGGDGGGGDGGGGGFGSRGFQGHLDTGGDPDDDPQSSRRTRWAIPPGRVSTMSYPSVLDSAADDISYTDDLGSYGLLPSPGLVPGIGTMMLNYMDQSEGYETAGAGDLYDDPPLPPPEPLSRLVLEPSRGLFAESVPSAARTSSRSTPVDTDAPPLRVRSKSKPAPEMLPAESAPLSERSSSRSTPVDTDAPPLRVRSKSKPAAEMLLAETAPLTERTSSRSTPVDADASPLRVKSKSRAGDQQLAALTERDETGPSGQLLAPAVPGDWADLSTKSAGLPTSPLAAGLDDQQQQRQRRRNGRSPEDRPSRSAGVPSAPLSTVESDSYGGDRNNRDRRARSRSRRRREELGVVGVPPPVIPERKESHQIAAYATLGRGAGLAKRSQEALERGGGDGSGSGGNGGSSRTLPRHVSLEELKRLALEVVGGVDDADDELAAYRDVMGGIGAKNAGAKKLDEDTIPPPAAGTLSRRGRDETDVRERIPAARSASRSGAVRSPSRYDQVAVAARSPSRSDQMRAASPPLPPPPPPRDVLAPRKPAPERLPVDDISTRTLNRKQSRGVVLFSAVEEPEHVREGDDGSVLPFDGRVVADAFALLGGAVLKAAGVGVGAVNKAVAVVVAPLEIPPLAQSAADSAPTRSPILSPDRPDPDEWVPNFATNILPSAASDEAEYPPVPAPRPRPRRGSTKGDAGAVVSQSRSDPLPPSHVDRRDAVGDRDTIDAADFPPTPPPRARRRKTTTTTTTTSAPTPDAPHPSTHRRSPSTPPSRSTDSPPPPPGPPPPRRQPSDTRLAARRATTTTTPPPHPQPHGTLPKPALKPSTPPSAADVAAADRAEALARAKREAEERARGRAHARAMRAAVVRARSGGRAAEGEEDAVGVVDDGEEDEEEEVDARIPLLAVRVTVQNPPPGYVAVGGGGGAFAVRVPVTASFSEVRRLVEEALDAWAAVGGSGHVAGSVKRMWRHDEEGEDEGAGRIHLGDDEDWAVCVEESARSRRVEVVVEVAWR